MNVLHFELSKWAGLARKRKIVSENFYEEFSSNIYIPCLYKQNVYVHQYIASHIDEVLLRPVL
jgi:hypothetical protein